MRKPHFLGISIKFLKLRLFCRSWLHVHADGLFIHIYVHESDGKTGAACWYSKEGLLVAWLAIFSSFSSNATSYNCFVLNTYKMCSRAEEENPWPLNGQTIRAAGSLQLLQRSLSSQPPTQPFKPPNFSAVLTHWICHFQAFILPVIPMHNTHRGSFSSLSLSPV